MPSRAPGGAWRHTARAGWASIERSGADAVRWRARGVQRQQYNLYTDVSCTFVWGDGTGATANVSGAGAGGPMDIPVYGRIPARQHVHTGAYSDSIVVTVTSDPGAC